MVEGRAKANTKNAENTKSLPGAPRLSQHPPSYSAQIAVHPEQPDTVIAGISRGFRGGDAALYRSTERGETWTRVTAEHPSLAATIFKALAFSRSTPEVVAAGTLAGEVWLSGDGGRTWAAAASGLPPVRSLLVE